MDLPQPEVEILSLVFVGRFAPQIIQPSRLAKFELIPDSLADSATVGVISAEVTQFSADWLDIQVTQERLQLQTELSHSFIALFDRARGILSSTPFVRIDAMGINNDAHFRLLDEEVWHRLGHRLAPKDLWDSVTSKPGLSSLSIEGERSDGRAGKHIYRVEPSKLAGPYGVAASSNDHFDVASNKSKESATTAERLLADVFRESLARSKEFFTQLLSFAQDSGEVL